MNRMIKHMIRTVTTVTWSIRWEEGDVAPEAPQEESIVSAGYALPAEEASQVVSTFVEIDPISSSSPD